MKVLLRVDNREPDQLKKLFSGAVEFSNLPAGDFEFVNIGVNPPATLLIIERKDVDDLAASLVDGRFDQQKAKLSAACSGLFPIAYLIEGEYQGHEKQSAIETVMLTTPFRDGFFILQTANIQQTYEMMIRIADLYTREKMTQLSDAELHRRFISSRSAHRGGGMFSKQDNWWVVSLGQIPGIGPQAATAIASVYPTVDSLVTAYKSSAAPSELLKEIKGGSRKIGPKASETVWKTIMPSTEAITVPKVAKKKTTKPKKTETSECLFTNDNDDSY